METNVLLGSDVPTATSIFGSKGSPVGFEGLMLVILIKCFSDLEIEITTKNSRSLRGGLMRSGLIA